MHFLLKNDHFIQKYLKKTIFISFLLTKERAYSYLTYKV